jgi:beta-barrel assembly-enhancing protease
LNFSRDMEREADRIGFGIMTEAGFSGEGFVSMFDKLQQAARLNDDGSFPYLRSHPLTTERMADMKARIPGLRSPLEAGTPAVSATYHALMSARARVLAETSTERLRNIASVLSQPTPAPTDPTALASVYGATLAAARTRDAQGLRWGLRRLEAAQTGDAPSRQAIQWLQLETLLMLPDAANNASLRQRRDDLAQLGLSSSDREGVLLGAQAAVAGSAEQQRLATQRLLRWVVLYPQDALAWQTLSSLHQALQQPVRAARADAEARLARLDAASALDRFKAAQQWARDTRPVDHIELSIIDARVRHTEALLREQLRDAATDRN